MARSARRRDFVDRTRQTRQELNQLRVQPGPEDGKTLLAPGGLDTSSTLLPFHGVVGWVIRGVGGELGAGEVTLKWWITHLGGTPFLLTADHRVTTVTDEYAQDFAFPFHALTKGARVWPEIVADDGFAEDLSATIYLSTTAV